MLQNQILRKIFLQGVFSFLARVADPETENKGAVSSEKTVALLNTE